MGLPPHLQKVFLAPAAAAAINIQQIWACSFRSFVLGCSFRTFFPTATAALKVVPVLHSNLLKHFYLKHVELELWFHLISYISKNQLVSRVKSFQLIEH